MKCSALIAIFALLLAAPLRAQVVYVDVTATGANNGANWADAFTSLQPAITAADPGNAMVWVADGTYTLAAPLNMADGVAVYGGFTGGGSTAETLLSQRDPALNVTTIDLALAQTIAFPAISSAVLDGFRLTQLPTFNVAITATGSNTIAVNNINVPDLGNSYGVLSVMNSVASASGLYIRDDGGAGGAATGVGVATTSTLTLQNSVFSGLAGISVQVQNGANVANVYNSTFHNVGWGLRVSGDVPSSATNCIFTGVTSGYAVHETTLGGDVAIRNCLFFGNGSVDVRDEGSINVGGAANINAIPGNANNLEGDPVYANAAAGDFALGDFSAAVDQGDDSAAPNLDACGAVRLDNPSFANGPTGFSDLGAYEATPSIVPVEISAFSID